MVGSGGKGSRVFRTEQSSKFLRERCLDGAWTAADETCGSTARAAAKAFTDNEMAII
jgi:hypothetical protein